MKTLLSLLVVSFCFISAVQAQDRFLEEPSIETVTDEFRGTSYHQVEVGEVGGPRLMIIAANVEGRVRYSLIFSSTSRNSWRYLQCRSFDILAPVPGLEERSAYSGTAEHDGRVGRGYVIEHLTVELTDTAMQQLAQSSFVRFRACNDVFALPANFKDYVAQLRERVSR